MREYTTPVEIELGAPKEERTDHKCIVCAFTGTKQERYDHETACLTHTQEQVKAMIRAEKNAMRTR